AGRRDVALDEVADELDVLGLIERPDVAHTDVAASLEVTGDVQDVGDASRHAGGEVASRAPEHDDAAARHVLAAMVADAFHDGVSAAVADGKALAGDATDERLTTGRAVEGHVTDDDVLLGGEGRAPRRKDDQPPARQSLAPVVVGVALEHEGDAARYERAERLPGRSSRPWSGSPCSPCTREPPPRCSGRRSPRTPACR